MESCILDVLSNYTNKISDPKNLEMFDPDLKFPQHESYVVSASYEVYNILKMNSIKIPMSKIIKIYQKHSGLENADKSRVREYMVLQ
jgi:hypothetical protein